MLTRSIEEVFWHPYQSPTCIKRCDKKDCYMKGPLAKDYNKDFHMDFIKRVRENKLMIGNLTLSLSDDMPFDLLDEIKDLPCTLTVAGRDLKQAMQASHLRANTWILSNGSQTGWRNLLSSKTIREAKEYTSQFPEVTRVTHLILPKPRLGSNYTSKRAIIEALEAYNHIASYLKDKCTCIQDECLTRDCSAGSKKIHIWPNGTITACPYDSEGITRMKSISSSPEVEPKKMCFLHNDRLQWSK